MNWQYLEALLALWEAARLLQRSESHLENVCKGSSALLGSLGWDVSASVRPWSCSAAELQGIGVNSEVMPLQSHLGNRLYVEVGVVSKTCHWGEGRAGLGNAYRCSCTRAGAQEPGLVTPAVRNSEILLLPSAGNGQDRSELSNCFFQPTRQDQPITSWSPISRLKCWIERLESEWGWVWWGGSDPKIKCFKREAEQIY